MNLMTADDALYLEQQLAQQEPWNAALPVAAAPASVQGFWQDSGCSHVGSCRRKRLYLTPHNAGLASIS
jgi:hypothetical protein